MTIVPPNGKVGDPRCPSTWSNCLSDLQDETGSVNELLADLDDEGWNMPTPATGWAIRDQVSHLAYFDDAAVMAAVEPDRFLSEAGSSLRSTAQISLPMSSSSTGR